MTNDIMIQVDHITKKFGKLKAVDDVSLTLKKGEIVCLIGPSGSGKSTVLRCIDHLENMIWGDVIISPFDATSKVYKCKGNKYRCKNTGKYFNVKTGTLFDNTKIELRKWFMAIWLVTSHKKGISSVQLSKDIGVTQKTAWFMLERIRKCFSSENNNSLDDVVEVDETYIGGKNKNRHNG